ncbi:DUF4249 domain-containing protein [Mucilaginibacter gilvus]|uniref:DUF4249 domain-containing protein n=1 Tax=Mucilaginibacter gilvus TaxID=2305909 RepID=A0A444MHB1_9SPHI|nr:DUF4249 domain-containing protein [Mucilaginibacter gilvus]RWY46005.1 DUF4249 domain-containing protein [Mucilaginibacter gilvus]
MRKNIKYIVYLVLLIAGIACKKPYSPTLAATANNYLVVEGFINSGNDSTLIKLSHTVNLGDTVSTAAERSAALTVEGNGKTYQLNEIKAGVYAAAPLNLDASQKYHLRIKLSNGKEYLSDDSEVKLTPPVDTITYDIKSSGLQINVSAHDPAANTRYYRWDYDETWLFHAKYISNYRVVNGDILPRTSDDQVFICFGNHSSSTVTLASTVKLASDVVNNAPITNIIPTSEKVSLRYSILIKQYALTAEAFAFWENLRKNTEQLGSIFDALPSEIKGNIHNTTDAKEPVVGFISVGTMTSKRIFVDKDDLPKSWLVEYPYDCQQDSTYFVNPLSRANDVAAFIISGIYLPTYAITGPKGGPAIGYGRANPFCADCTSRGVKRRPDFWRDK